VDTSGAALAAVLPARPVLVKPNVHELADLVGAPIETFGDVESAARETIRRGAAAVLASLGADGAMLVTGDQALYGRAREIPFVNSVGAGDALLSGYVAEQSDDLGDRLRNAVLWASSAVSHPTTLFPIRRDFAERVEVTRDFDRGARLSEPSLDLVAG
jgi:1-phosphofructokinase